MNSGEMLASQEQLSIMELIITNLGTDLIRYFRYILSFMRRMHLYCTYMYIYIRRLHPLSN